MSKQATWGRPSNAAVAASMPAMARGWCRGASGVRRAMPARDVVVDQRGRGVGAAAVYDPVPDRRRRMIVLFQRAEVVAQIGSVSAAVPVIDIAAAAFGFVRCDDRELEAARAGVEDQYARPAGQRGHRRPGTWIARPPAVLARGTGSPWPACVPLPQTHWVISGMSSPWATIQARCRALLSVISWRSTAARGPSPGTRSITSITRWNLSMSLSTSMSNGVVVVPSSRYPRTCRLS